MIMIYTTVFMLLSSTHSNDKLNKIKGKINV